MLIIKQVPLTFNKGNLCSRTGENMHQGLGSVFLCKQDRVCTPFTHVNNSKNALCF